MSRISGSASGVGTVHRHKPGVQGSGFRVLGGFRVAGFRK